MNRVSWPTVAATLAILYAVNKLVSPLQNPFK
jgi:hypothetical protein